MHRNAQIDGEPVVGINVQGFHDLVLVWLRWRICIRKGDVLLLKVGMFSEMLQETNI